MAVWALPSSLAATKGILLRNIPRQTDAKLQPLRGSRETDAKSLASVLRFV